MRKRRAERASASQPNPQGVKLPDGCPDHIRIDVQWDFLQPLYDAIGDPGGAGAAPPAAGGPPTRAPSGAAPGGAGAGPASAGGGVRAVPAGREFTVSYGGVPVVFAARLNTVVAMGAGRVAVDLPRVGDVSAGGARTAGAGAAWPGAAGFAGSRRVYASALTAVRDGAPPALAGAVSERLRGVQRRLGARNNEVGARCGQPAWG